MNANRYYNIACAKLLLCRAPRKGTHLAVLGFLFAEQNFTVACFCFWFAQLDPQIFLRNFNPKKNTSTPYLSGCCNSWKKIFQLNASLFFKCASKPINTQMMYVCAARAIHTALIASFITFCAPHLFPRSIFLFIIIMFFRLFCLLYVEHLCVICRSSESEWFGRIKNIRAHILGKSMHRFVISNNNNWWYFSKYTFIDYYVRCGGENSI